MAANGKTPDNAVNVRRNHIDRTPKSTALIRKSSNACKAAVSSCRPSEKSFTVEMFVIVSTICPVTAARAPARAFDFLRTRGMKNTNAAA